MTIMKSQTDKEILYSPDPECHDTIQIAKSAVPSVTLGISMVQRLLGQVFRYELKVGDDGNAHLGSGIAKAALYGMNIVSEQYNPGEIYYLRRKQLAEAILQQAYGLRVDQVSTYEPDPYVIERMLTDKTFVQELGDSSREDALLSSYVAALANNQA